MNPLQWPLLESGTHSGPGNSPTIGEEKRPETPDAQQLLPLNEAKPEEKQQLFTHHQQNKEEFDETTQIAQAKVFDDNSAGVQINAPKDRFNNSLKATKC